MSGLFDHLGACIYGYSVSCYSRNKWKETLQRLNMLFLPSLLSSVVGNSNVRERCAVLYIIFVRVMEYLRRSESLSAKILWHYKTSCEGELSDLL